MKAGEPLDERERQELLARLFACALPPHDVHGRSTIVQLPREELERALAGARHPGHRRAHRHRQDRRRPRPRRALAARGRLGRLPPGLPPPRHRHRQAARQAGSRASRTTGSIWSPPASATARADSPGRRPGWIADIRGARADAGRGRRNRTLREGAGRRALRRTAARSGCRRKDLERWTATLEPVELVRWAGRLDPGFKGGGRQRAARAIEVALLTGRPLSYWQAAGAGPGGDHALVCRAHRAAGRCCISGSWCGPRRWCGGG